MSPRASRRAGAGLFPRHPAAAGPPAGHRREPTGSLLLGARTRIRATGDRARCHADRAPPWSTCWRPSTAASASGRWRHGTGGAPGRPSAVHQPVDGLYSLVIPPRHGLRGVFSSAVLDGDGELILLHDRWRAATARSCSLLLGRDRVRSTTGPGRMGPFALDPDGTLLIVELYFAGFPAEGNG
jgi:hypothetical protein